MYLCVEDLNEYSLFRIEICKHNSDYCESCQYNNMENTVPEEIDDCTKVAECIESLNISAGNYRFFDFNPANDCFHCGNLFQCSKIESHFSDNCPYYIESIEMVFAYLENHPDATVGEIANQFNVDTNIVRPYINEWKDKRRKQKAELLKRQPSDSIKQIVFRYLKENPNATTEEISEILMIKKSTAGMYKNKWWALKK